MKLAKTTVLVTAAALALLALASPASATICSGSGFGEGCFTAAHGRHFTGKYHAMTTKASFIVTDALANEIRTGECESTIEGSITNATTNVGNVSALTFTNCKFTNCTNPTLGPVKTKLPWGVTVTPWGKNNTNGTLHIANPGLVFTGLCSFTMITCEYEESTATAEIKGGAPATLVFSEPLLKRTVGPASLCGEKIHWTGTYTFKTPTSLYIE